jgi:hypothetical protein
MAADIFEAYRTMLVSLFLSTIILVIIMAVLLVWADSAIKKSVPAAADASIPIASVNLPILAFVAMAGALGAFFSALSRLYSLNDLPAALMHPDLRRLRNKYLLMYSLIPPLTGIIGAVVLYVMVAGNLLDGDLFAHFECSLGKDQCGKQFINLLSWAPDQAKDYAKALVWGFVAGFSERLVPDAIGRLGEKVPK